MSRQTWVTRDGDGRVVSTTEVRRSSGCGGCLTVLAVIVAVVGPAAWAGNGDIPVALAVAMYVVEAVIVVAAMRQYAGRQRSR